MEAWLVLLAIFLLAVPLGGLALGFSMAHRRDASRRRDEVLSAEIRSLRAGLESFSRRLERIEGARFADIAATVSVVPAPASVVSAPTPVVPTPAPVVPSPAAPINAPSPAVAPRDTLFGSSTAAPPPASSPRKEPAGFEMELSTRVAVWIGALALALAGAFLVKWSFDQGLLGPAMRVTLGIAFGAALVGLGEWLRTRSARVAGGLVAAGIATLFSALLAATSLYGLIPRPLGFVLLAATTAAAVLLALRHGPLIALLGLVGGFLTPALIGAEEPNPWSLFGYLFLLVGGLMAVSRRRGWWPIAALTLAGAFGWALLAITNLERFGMSSTAPVSFFLLATIAASVLMTVAGSWEDRRVPLGLVWAATGGGVILLGLTASIAGFRTPEWIYFGILAAGCLALGRWSAEYDGLPWAASLFGAGLLAISGRQADPDPARLWWTAVTLGALHAGGAYAALWGSRAPDRWAALSTVSGIAWFLAAWSALRHGAWPMPWAVQSVALAAAFAVASVPVKRRRAALARGDHALAALAVAATAFVSLAVPLHFERAWISVAWAIEIPAVAWIALRLRVPFLDRVVWALAAGVCVRLLLNPAVLFDYPIGSGIVFNWLLFGYGVPVIAFAGAAAIYRRGRNLLLSEAMEGAAIVFGTALCTLEVRRFFHPDHLAATPFELAEWGTLATIWLLYGLALLSAHDALGRRVLDWGGRAIGVWGLALAGIGPCLASNPLQVPHHVGSMPLFNRLLFVYGAPAVLGAILARRLRRREPPALSLFCAGASFVLLFVLVSLSVRQAFHGDVLAGGTTTNAEMYSYSAAWVALATLLLVVGIVTRGPVVRAASALVMALAVGKVFLYDTAQLRDLYRVFSLLGLGASLMLLAYLYQRFVFGDRSGGKAGRA